MPSFKTVLALLALAILSANTQTTYTIDPDSVPLATRENWCQSQVASCPLLCLQNDNATDDTTTDNECDPTTLVYSCICGNGISPNLNNFSQTIPFFECQEYGNQCVNACAQGDSACQTACRVDHPCGAQSPTRVNTTTSSSAIATTAATATSSGAGTVYTGLGASSATTSKKSGSRAALDAGRSYGLGLVFAGLFAGFAFMM